MGDTSLEAMYQLLLWLVPTLEKFPKSQKFQLGDRIQATAMSVLDEVIAATFTRGRLRHRGDREVLDQTLRRIGPLKPRGVHRTGSTSTSLRLGEHTSSSNNRAAVTVHRDFSSADLHVCSAFRSICLASGFAHRDVERRLGVTAPTLHKWEDGQTRLSPDRRGLAPKFRHAKPRGQPMAAHIARGNATRARMRSLVAPSQPNSAAWVWSYAPLAGPVTRSVVALYG